MPFIKGSRRNVPAPEWIKNLPPGTYDSKQLIAATGMYISSMQKLLIKYGATMIKEPCHTNLMKSVFIWEGYKPKEDER